MTRLNPEAELSKSRFFSVKDGTIILADLAGREIYKSDRLTQGVIDQKYQILGLLGEGGMGAVFRAHHLMLNKDVALKTFKSANLTEEERLRFQREAQAIAKLNHKNVVQVFDFGLSEDGVPYYTMEYLHGQSLAERIRSNGPLPVTEAVAFFIEVAQGLSLAHSKGIIHRDLKPANLFIENVESAQGSKNTIKIVDFGIASLANQSAEGQKLTTMGMIFGSPLYMSPEQSMGKTITVRADIYSLGCSLFEALTGNPPYRAGNPLETIMLHHNARTPTLTEASGGKEYPPALERAVAAMLAKLPEGRQANMEQVEGELSRMRPSQKTGDHRVMAAESKPLEKLQAAAPQETIETGQTPAKNTSALPIALTASLVFVGAGLVCYLNSKKPAIISPKVEAVQRPIPSAPIRTIKHVGNKIYLVFAFAPDLDLGDFTSCHHAGGKIHATGEIQWESDLHPTFEPSAKFIENQNNFAAFQPDDLGGLLLKHGEQGDKNPKLMKKIGTLTGLRVLDISASTIGDTDLPEIAKLTNLQTLIVNESEISGQALATLPRLRQLKEIGFGNCADAGKLVAALKNDTNLHILDLSNNGDILTEADFKTISTLSELNTLYIKNSGFPGSRLALLTPLKKLHMLSINFCRLTKEAIAALTVMAKNGLQIAELNSQDVTQNDLQKLQYLIPGANFHDPYRIKKGDPSQKEWQEFPAKLDKGPVEGMK